jgi:tRNA pseudouridine55 synthase
VTDGVLLIDKPPGKTSHDVVAAVRRTLPRKTKVGHAGTLDPFATGLLLVLVGRAARAQRFFMDQPKAYVTVARLGWTSSTGDPEGELSRTGRIPPDPPALPTGEVRQRPPAHSAVKIDGERAYVKARRGEEVQMPERTVRVDRFEQLWREGDRAAFAIECSSGTYVRSLIGDLGDAYCLELRRTRIGPFDVAQAGEGRESDLVPLAEGLAAVLPVLEIDADCARRAGHGQAVEVPGAPDAGPFLLLHEGTAVAISERGADGLVRPSVGFPAQSG